MAKTTYIWNEVTDNVAVEKDDQGNVSSYTQCPELYGKVLSQNRNGSRSYYHYDGQGSVRQLTDSTGNVTDEATHTAFGETVAKTGSTVNPWGYKGALGYYSNPTTEDLYMRARSMSSRTGRWLPEDPLGVLGVLGGANLYTYASNNPLTYSDPNGLLVVLDENPFGVPPTCGCGQATVKWFLDPKVPSFIVQKLEMSVNIAHCEDTCGCKVTKKRSKISTCVIELLHTAGTFQNPAPVQLVAPIKPLPPLDRVLAEPADFWSVIRPKIKAQTPCQTSGNSRMQAEVRATNDPRILFVPWKPPREYIDPNEGVPFKVGYHVFCDQQRWWFGWQNKKWWTESAQSSINHTWDCCPIDLKAPNPIGTMEITVKQDNGGAVNKKLDCKSTV